MRRELHHSAGIVLFRRGEEREYLLLRSALTRRPVWEFPKGAIERGESQREAAERELREESGLAHGDYVVLDGFEADEHYFFTRGVGGERRLIRKQVVYFIAEWRSGEVRISSEATDFSWSVPGEARRLLRFPEKRRILENAERWLTERVQAYG